MADRQMGALSEQMRQLEATLDELKALRDETARTLGA
jgi:hypothetical protein